MLIASSTSTPWESIFQFAHSPKTHLTASSTVHGVLLVSPYRTFKRRADGWSAHLMVTCRSSLPPAGRSSKPPALQNPFKNWGKSDIPTVLGCAFPAVREIEMIFPRLGEIEARWKKQNSWLCHKCENWEKQQVAGKGRFCFSCCGQNGVVEETWRVGMVISPLPTFPLLILFRASASFSFMIKLINHATVNLTTARTLTRVECHVLSATACHDSFEPLSFKIAEAKPNFVTIHALGLNRWFKT